MRIYPGRGGHAPHDGQAGPAGAESAVLVPGDRGTQGGQGVSVRFDLVFDPGLGGLHRGASATWQDRPGHVRPGQGPAGGQHHRSCLHGAPAHVQADGSGDRCTDGSSHVTHVQPSSVLSLISRSRCSRSPGAPGPASPPGPPTRYGVAPQVTDG
ncbi:hypothetical protein ACFFX0_06345 [Citricoccus parietis]|uniref:Uncharacterized protein n=1 Tax=Citricoccus parietis TaxID=592307 RepID=A0ABV5FWJ6_9MICC